MSKASKATLRNLLYNGLNIGSNVLLGIIATAVVMVALAFIVNVFNVPNPNMILISGLVICASVFGFPGGITGAIVMMAYSLYFFSTDHDFVTFADQNTQKMIVSIIGIVVTAAFVSTLRHITGFVLDETVRLNEELEEDNRLLKEMSIIDSLTGARNRFALRNDFPSYLDQDLHVMMVDVDNFKQLNDAFGHQEGDRILSSVGKALVGMSPQYQVYRYGGDEFLMLCPGAREADFVAQANEVKTRLITIDLPTPDHDVHLSAGYVYGNPLSQSDLRLMIHQADMNLYHAKHAGKDLIVGEKYSRAKAKSHDVTHRGAIHAPSDE